MGRDADVRAVKIDCTKPVGSTKCTYCTKGHAKLFKLTALRINRTTLVDELDGYRSRKHDVNWFMKMVKRNGDSAAHTHLEKLKFLTWGSPNLRAVLSEVKKTILDPEGSPSPNPRKLLAVCDSYDSWVLMQEWFTRVSVNESDMAGEEIQRCR